MNLSFLDSSFIKLLAQLQEIALEIVNFISYSTNVSVLILRKYLCED